VSAATRLKFLYLAYASQPKSERFLYRAVRKRRAARLVEFGITSLTRSRRLIEVAQRYASGEVCFTAIDPFESATAPAPCEGAEKRLLIHVFRTLKSTGACLRLLPGSVASVLPDVANSLPKTDLLLIGHAVCDAELARAWFYLPRMLHEGSLVLRESAAAGQVLTFETVARAKIEALAFERRRSAA
jgi:hypothetical protein